MIVFPRIPINSIVEINKERYRVEQWHKNKSITYKFNYIGENGKIDFEKTEEQVAEALNRNIIKILNN